MKKKLLVVALALVLNSSALALAKDKKGLGDWAPYNWGDAPTSHKNLVYAEDSPDKSSHFYKSSGPFKFFGFTFHKGLFAFNQSGLYLMRFEIKGADNYGRLASALEKKYGAPAPDKAPSRWQVAEEYFTEHVPESPSDFSQRKLWALGDGPGTLVALYYFDDTQASAVFLADSRSIKRQSLASPSENLNASFAVPFYDIDSFCRTASEDSGAPSLNQDACLAEERAAQARLKLIEPPESVFSLCDSVASGPNGGSYRALESCIKEQR